MAFYSPGKFMNHVNSSPSYPQEVHQDVLTSAVDTLSCPVCTNWLLPSTVLECGHALCSHCAENWLPRQPNCPVCRCSVGAPHPCRPVDAFLSGVLSRHGSYSKGQQLDTQLIQDTCCDTDQLQHDDGYLMVENNGYPAPLQTDFQTASQLPHRAQRESWWGSNLPTPNIQDGHVPRQSWASWTTTADETPSRTSYAGYWDDSQAAVHVHPSLLQGQYLADDPVMRRFVQPAPAPAELECW